MKILWFTNSPSLAGKQIDGVNVGRSWVEALENELSKIENIDLGICFPSNSEKNNTFKIANTTYFPVTKKKNNSRIGRLYTRWLHKVTFNQSLSGYLKVINEFSPDIVQIFGTESDFGLLIPKIKSPCVIHLQGILAMVNQKWNCGLSESEVLRFCNKKSLLKGSGFFHDKITLKKEMERERQIFKDANCFMGRTDWDKRIVSVLAPHAIYFHCDEIMREKFYKYIWTQPVRNNTWVMMSTIRKNIYKGLETIFECKRILEEVLSNFKIIWKIAGIDSGDEIVYLLKKKYKMDLKKSGIQFLGQLQEDKLIDEMLDSDLFVHPSHVENSANSICEAMLLGMPVIATFAGGTASILEDKKEGLLVQEGDPLGMAGSIMELLNDKGRACYLGLNARNRAILRHNPKKVINDLLAIYSSIISM